jgi:hypothetical protein
LISISSSALQTDQALPSASKHIKRIGRPPYTQLQVIRVLKHHPELWNKPSALASILLRQNSSSTLSPKAVSEAISKIRSRHGGLLDIESICEDCLGKIVSAQGEESVCESCGRTYGHKEANQTNDHSEYVNALWSAYNAKDRLHGHAGTRRISHEAARIQQFGFGTRGKLIERSLSALAEICKSHPDLSQDITNAIAKSVIQNCNERARQIPRVSSIDVKDCVSLGLVELARLMPEYQKRMLQIVGEVCEFLPDVAASSPKFSKSPKISCLDFRALD